MDWFGIDLMAAILSEEKTRGDRRDAQEYLTVDVIGLAAAFHETLGRFFLLRQVRPARKRFVASPACACSDALKTPSSIPCC